MKLDPFIGTLASSILGLAVSCSTGEKPEPAVLMKPCSALLRDLKSKSPETRLEAATELGKLGVAAKRAVPAMIAALEDEDPFVLSQLAKSLREIGPPGKSDIPAIIDLLLKHPAKYGRMGAAETLGRVSSPTPAIREALTVATRDHDEFVRGAACEALRKRTGPK